MFENLQPAPPDSIFGLNDQFLKDPHPDKINLTVGVYQDEQSRTPILAAVRRAVAELAANETTKDYVSMNGWAGLVSGVSALVLGEDLAAYREGRFRTLQTLGGTGALRLTADLLGRSVGCREIYYSTPTWPNHLSIFKAAGLEPKPYRYLNQQSNRLDFAGMIDDLQALPRQTPVLLHTVCHNPTGFDLDRDQWSQLTDVFARNGLVAVFDFAYQGFDRSIEEDREPIRQFCDRQITVFVCNSFSKNMGLYGERVGGCTVVAGNAAQAAAVHSHLKLHARCSYSNPVRHGGQVAAALLQQPDLRTEWLSELDEMRQRVDQMRSLLLGYFRDKAPHLDFECLAEQRGMFGFSGIPVDQVCRLREEYSIYLLNNGRINLAGVNPRNAERLVDAIIATSETTSDSAHVARSSARQ